MGLPTDSQGGWRGCKRAGRAGGGGLYGISGGVEEGAVGEHGAGDGEEAVADAAEGAAVGVAAMAESGVAVAALRIVLDGDTSPVIDGIAEAAMAGQAAEDEGVLAAAAGDGGDAGQRPPGAGVSAFLTLRFPP